MKTFKLLFFVFLIFSCSDSSVIERWTDGTVKTKLFIDGNNKCYEYYGENNRVIEKGCFYGKEKNGKWITYYDDGYVKTITHYQHGVLGGEFTRYSENGNILESVLYIDGFKENEMNGDDNSSFKISQEEVFFDRNEKEELGYQKEFYENGNLKSIGKMHAILKVGEWKYFHPNGTLWAKGKYIPEFLQFLKKGVREDLSLRIFPEDGFTKIGKWKFYNSQKELLYIANYKLKNNKYTCRVKEIKN